MGWHGRNALTLARAVARLAYIPLLLGWPGCRQNISKGGNVFSVFFLLGADLTLAFSQRQRADGEADAESSDKCSRP